MNFENPKNNSAERPPSQNTKSKRPEGEYWAKPYQERDGQWYDGEGNKITQDQAYAIAFWYEKRKQLPSNDLFKKYKETLRESIENYAKNGTAFRFIDSTLDTVTEDDKMQLSAYRELAREMGYEMGQFKFNRKSGTAEASIKKIEK